MDSLRASPASAVVVLLILAVLFSILHSIGVVADTTNDDDWPRPTAGARLAMNRTGTV
jgi:hypothetical protein